MIRSRGFTLIEVMLVVLVLAIVSGAAALKLADSLRSAASEDMPRQLLELDDLARSSARNSGRRTQIVFDIDRNEAWYRQAGVETVQAAMNFGRSTLREVTIADERTVTGEVVIDCSLAGYTRSYCVTIAGADGKAISVCFVGLTGEEKVLHDSAKVQAILRP